MNMTATMAKTISTLLGFNEFWHSSQNCNAFSKILARKTLLLNAYG